MHDIPQPPPNTHMHADRGRVNHTHHYFHIQPVHLPKLHVFFFSLCQLPMHFFHVCVFVCVRLPLLQKRPRLTLPVHSMVCLCAFGLALPVAISLFPQNSQVSTRARSHFSLRPLSLCLPRSRLWFKMVFIKLFIHMVTEPQTYVLPTTSLGSPSPPLLLSSHSLAPSLHFSEGSRRTLPKNSTPVPPPPPPHPFSHPTGCLFQILPHTLTHSSPSVSEQNIASFGPGLDIYQCSLLRFSFS